VLKEAHAQLYTRGLKGSSLRGVLKNSLYSAVQGGKNTPLCKQGLKENPLLSCTKIRTLHCVRKNSLSSALQRVRTHHCVRKNSLSSAVQDGQNTPLCKQEQPLHSGTRGSDHTTMQARVKGNPLLSFTKGQNSPLCKTGLNPLLRCT
jgi:hypothetical protein